MPRIVLLLLLAVSGAGAQIPPIGIIDVYGLRTVSEQRVRAALGFAEGDSFPASKEKVERALMAIPGVVRARITGVCCDQRRSVVYVGIEEALAAVPHFRAAPAGPIRLPNEIVQAGDALSAATTAAVLRGDAGEDGSRGYSLMHDSTGRIIQERFIGFAARDAVVLRQVLRSSSDSSHRALAAQVIAYGTDRPAIIRELNDAILDPSSEVRNNAMRALALIANHAREHPELRLGVPWGAFFQMLRSPVWTDRNKASMALMQITEHSVRGLRWELRARALPELVEMTRWKSDGHAMAPFIILGRVAGLSDEAIYSAWSRRDRQMIIDAAMRSRDRKPPPRE